MASTRQGVRLSQRQRHALQRLVHEGAGGGAGLRATIILLSSEGQGAALIARTLGVGVRTVHECRRRWRRSGLEGLKDALRPGRPPRADASYIRLLVAAVQKDPRQLGFVFTRWTAPRLAEHLRRQTGVELSSDWVGELLRTHGFVWRRAKRTTRHLANRREQTAGPQAAAAP